MAFQNIQSHTTCNDSTVSSPRKLHSSKKKPKGAPENVRNRVGSSSQNLLILTATPPSSMVHPGVKFESCHSSPK